MLSSFFHMLSLSLSLSLSLTLSLSFSLFFSFFLSLSLSLSPSHAFACSKKSTKSDQQVEAASIEEAPESSLSQTLLAPDSVLWNHISFLQKYIQPLESVEAQAKKLAE